MEQAGAEEGVQALLTVNHILAFSLIVLVVAHHVLTSNAADAKG